MNVSSISQSNETKARLVLSSISQAGLPGDEKKAGAFFDIIKKDC